MAWICLYVSKGLVWWGPIAYDPFPVSQETLQLNTVWYRKDSPLRNKYIQILSVCLYLARIYTPRHILIYSPGVC